jgi:hypothetical protein
MRDDRSYSRTAAQKNFHKIFTFERTGRFFKVLVGALPISDYAGARFFVRWNRVTFGEADWNFWKRTRLIADDGFAVESRESLLLKSCVRQNRIR